MIRTAMNVESKHHDTFDNNSGVTSTATTGGEFKSDILNIPSGHLQNQRRGLHIRVKRVMLKILLYKNQTPDIQDEISRFTFCLGINQDNSTTVTEIKFFTHNDFLSEDGYKVVKWRETFTGLGQTRGDGDRFVQARTIEKMITFPGEGLRVQYLSDATAQPIRGNLAFSLVVENSNLLATYTCNTDWRVYFTDL